MQVLIISVLLGVALGQGPRPTCQEDAGQSVGFVFVGGKQTEQKCCKKQETVVCEPDAWYQPNQASSSAECESQGINRADGVEGKANIMTGSNGARVPICAWFKACEFYNPKNECVASQLGGKWRADTGILACGAGGCCKWEHKSLVTEQWNTWVQASGSCPTGDSDPNQVTGPYYMPGTDDGEASICVKEADGWKLYEGLKPINVQGSISDSKCLNGCCAY